MKFDFFFLLFLIKNLKLIMVKFQKSKKGQVVDAAMTDGSALLMTMIYSMQSSGLWKNSLGSNLLDGGSHFYDTYECKDGKFISIGSIEPQFYELLCKIAELDDSVFSNQMDRQFWPEQKKVIKEIFLNKTREEWCALMEGTDVCFAPVLNMAEAPLHPHNIERKTFIELEGVTQPAPAPRFSRTDPEIVSSPSLVGEHTDEVLKAIGLNEEDINSLKTSGAVA